MLPIGEDFQIRLRLSRRAMESATDARSAALARAACGGGIACSPNRQSTAHPGRRLECHDEMASRDQVGIVSGHSELNDRVIDAGHTIIWNPAFRSRYHARASRQAAATHG